MVELFQNIDLQHITDIFTLFMLLLTACGVALSRNLLISTVFLTIFSLLMALMYVILKAPDVAITEAAIGGGISTILFLCAIVLTGEKESIKKINNITYIVFAITAMALIAVITELPDWGSVDAPANKHVAPYYLNNTSEDIGIPNIVTAILASYRGFDTLGEVIVVFTACISVFALLYGRLTRKN